MNIPPPLPPPLIGSPPTSPPARKPPLVFYRSWCALLLVLWISMAVYGLLINRGVLDPSFGLIEGAVIGDDHALREKMTAEKRQDALGGAVLAALIAIFYGVAVCIPRRPWGRVVGMIAIIGSFFPFLITTAGMIPLLIAWSKPETRRYFETRK